MPIIRIEMFEGRPDEIKKELLMKVTTAAAEVLKIPAEHFTCIITDVPRKHWARGGVPFSEVELKDEGYKHVK